MIALNLSPKAKAIWNDLPGEYADKATLLVSLIAELRHVRAEAKIENAKARQSVKNTLRRPVGEVLAAAIGSTLSDCWSVRVPVLGVNLPLPTVFQIADRPTHPLHKACKAFLADHRLTVRSGVRAKGARGVTPSFLAREDDQ